MKGQRDVIKRVTGRTWMKLALGGALAALALALPALAEEPKPVGPALTPRLRQLLSEEMLSVKQAMSQILHGLSIGDHAIVASQAQQIHDSFILAKNLTEKDKKDLLKAVPPEFLKLDGAFHGTAKKLVEAATQRDKELEAFYFGRLVDGCQSCHSRFATDKFPGFAGKQGVDHVH